MLAKVLSAAIVGLDAVLIEVEVDIASQGLPLFTIVGLPDKAVEEAKERVRAALRNTGCDFPARRITVNLAPADFPKEGPTYDLPIALGILMASGQLEANIDDALIIGELSLTGLLRPTTGMLTYALLAQKEKLTKLFIPEKNAHEASIIDSISIYPTPSLSKLLSHFTTTALLPIMHHTKLADHQKETVFDYDMEEIKGQHQAKRAFEIAAAGSHNILLKGPPGAGKTLLARTLPSILPNLTLAEALEVTKIYSIAGLLESDALLTKHPFRSPHHTTSLVGLIGGGTNPKPGEVTLAHRGVLFLDELPEFPRHVLEGLRQPIEDGFVMLSRANGKARFPAKCMLVAAQNPCPCGYFGDPTHTCSCSTSQILRYQKKISGPLLDRIDMHLEVPAVKTEKLTSNEKNGESSIIIRRRVQRAKDKQVKRFADTKFRANAEISNKYIHDFCPLSEACLMLLKTAVIRLNLSGRSYHRIIKLARTIADLSLEEQIKPEHIAEALQYRPKNDSVVQ